MGGDLIKDVPEIVDETPDNGEIGALVAMAVRNNLDVEKLEKVIDLFNQQQDRQKREAFDEHYAAMQAECVAESLAATRTKKAYNYWYAPIETLQHVYDPIIHKHGFSYSWTFKDLTEGNIEVTMVLRGWGHREEFPLVIPPPADDGQKNPIHNRGKQTTYGRRYTFTSAIGVVIHDQDDDAEVEKISPEILCDDLRRLIEVKDIHPESVVMIKQELLKPLAERDIKKLRDWHKRAQSKPDKAK